MIIMTIIIKMSELLAGHKWPSKLRTILNLSQVSSL